MPMLLRTALQIKEPTPFAISHHSSLLTLGSCFAQHIGQRLTANKFDVLANPLGTLFNPLAIFKLLQQATTEAVDESLFVQHGAQWHHYDLHSQWVASDKLALKLSIQDQFRAVAQFCSQKQPIYMFTWGTAFVHKLKHQGQTVANCHKQPAHLFTKELLTSEEIVQAFWQWYNPALAPKVVLTVSPVRHTKEGLVENSLSKAILRVACDAIVRQARARNLPVVYFPSYEIMIDDLRDYRFYKADLIHPNAMAIGYIWKHFGDIFFEQPTKDLLQQWSKIRRALLHKPFQPNSPEHQQFLQRLLNQLEQLAPLLNLKQEIAQVKKQLIA